MSSTDPANAPQSNQSAQSAQSRSKRGRGRGGIRGRGRGRGGQGVGAQQRADNAHPDVRARPRPQPQPQPQPQVEPMADKPDSGDDTDPDAEVCFICAEPIKYTSIAPCNHRTCYICSLRMRALYKNKDCPHCRTSAPYVIFTNDNTEDGKSFDDYSNKDIAITDDNIGIKYTLSDIAADAVFFLHYNCPDPTCEYQGLGWPDLHRHVKSEHHKRLCDLCSRNKKVFTHEHVMFTDKELQTHNTRGDDRPGAVDQTGFKGHPMCEFCRERFYDDDKLYEHCRNKHERCFLCDRSNPARPHYFRNYDELEKHFRTDHYLCMDKECLEKKFVVFGSEMDLKGHQLSEHRDSVSKDVRRDAMTVDMSTFDYRPSYQHERRAGASSRHGTGRGRDPNAEPPPASSSHQHLRRDEIAFQRQLAVRTAQSLRPRTFGGQLTASETADAPARESSQSSSHPRDSNATASAPSSSSRVQTTLQDAMGNTTVNDPASMSAEERARLVRHGAVLERAGNLLGNEPSKLSTFRTHVGCYQRGSFTANQLIDSFFTLFSDCSTTALGTLVREVADLYEDKKKGSDLLKAWQDWRAINEDYPSLPNLSNMHGGSSSSIVGGWASTAAAAAPVLRVTNTKQALRLKKSTRASKISTNNRQTSIAYITGASSSSRAAPPQQSTQAFPALPKANVSASDSSASRSAAAGWGAAVTRSTGSTGSTNPTSTQKGKKVQIGSEEAFPSLPAAPKPQTTIFGYGRGAVRRDFGQTQSTGFEWGGNNASSSSNKDKGELGGSDEEEQEGGKKGKKGKKKGKQVLVAWG